MSTLIFTGDPVMPERWPPYNGYPFKPMPTAIIRICTNKGIVVAADGLELINLQKEKQRNLQKIYQVPNHPLTYVLFGHTGIRVSGKMIVNLIDETRESARSLKGIAFDDLALYAEHFSRPIQKVLWAKRKDGSIPYFAPGPEEGQPGDTILHVFFFGYIRGIASTVDLRFFHRNSIPSEPSITSLNNDIGFPPFIAGSLIVGNLLFNSDHGLQLRTPPDERFSRYRKSIPDDWKNLTIFKASKIARDYIRACKSDLGREVDYKMCRTIGGHIHIAKITPVRFQWIIPPKDLSAHI